MATRITPAPLKSKAISIVCAVFTAVTVSAKAPTPEAADVVLNANGYIASPLHVALRPFERRILEMHNGDTKAAKQSVEQWVSMFSSLSVTNQKTVLSDLSTGDARTFYQTVRGGIANKLAFAIGASTGSNASGDDSQKLNATPAEYIFVPSAPCRVSDTRSWGGAIGGQRIRPSYVYSVSPGYTWGNQGGTGTPGTGNCATTLFPSGTTAPVSALATVTVFPTARGNLRAWNGSATIPLASMLNFQAGQAAANTTVIPIDRLVTKYAGGDTDGTFGDIAIWNESAGPADVIVDVVGYFVKPTAYAMQCGAAETVTVTSTGTGYLNVSANACPTGWSRTGLLCDTSSSTSNLQSVGYPSNGNGCEWSITSNGSSYRATNLCCQVPY